MGTKENKELVRKFWEATAKGDYEAFGDYIAEDGVDHTSMPGQPPGLEGVKYIFKRLKAAMPDFSQEIVDMVAGGRPRGGPCGLTGQAPWRDDGHSPDRQEGPGRRDPHRAGQRRQDDRALGLVDQAALMAQPGVMPGGN